MSKMLPSCSENVLSHCSSYFLADSLPRCDFVQSIHEGANRGIHRNLAIQNVCRGYRGSVHLLVLVFVDAQHCAIQCHAHEQTLCARVRIDCGFKFKIDACLCRPANWPGDGRSVHTEFQIPATLELV